jgi:ABC-2 type transport system ATP-binding protein
MDKHALAIATFGLTKEFGSRRAVDNMNLAIAPGGVFGFLGPNGAGKTTTIRMLLGLIRPTGGSGSILGYDIVAERSKILPHVGAIVESPAFYPYLSGRDNLRALARTAGGENARRIAEVLDMVDLGGRAGDKVKTYSLGMKQRLAIAAALLNDPQIIFLDEPTNGLDPAGTVEIRELIRRLAASGHTIFLSSHLLYEVEQIATEVAIIDKGKLVTQGHVAELTREGAALLVEADPLPIVRQVAERMGAASEQRGPRLAELRLAPERAPDLVAALVQAGAHVFQVTPQRSSLEQLFLSLTGSEKSPDAAGHQPSAIGGQPAVARS